MQRWIITILSLFAVVMGTVAFDLRENVNVILDGFETRGKGQDGETAWELKGARGVLRGPVYELYDVDLKIHTKEGETFVIRSETCRFNRSRGLLQSDAPVIVQGPDLVLEGRGYDLLTGARRLRLRRDVRMQVRYADDQAATVRSGLGLPTSRHASDPDNQPAPGSAAEQPDDYPEEAR